MPTRGGMLAKRRDMLADIIMAKRRTIASNFRHKAIARGDGGETDDFKRR